MSQLTPEMRQNFVMQHEGQAIALAGNHGSDIGADLIRCSIDGGINALMRVGGPDAAAKYAFALCDRVVAGVRLPTVPAIGKLTPPAPPVELPKITAGKPVSTYAIWLTGYLVGFAIAIAMGMAR